MNSLELTPRDIHQRLTEIGEELRRTLKELEETSRQAAMKDSTYRLARVQAFLRSQAKTVAERGEEARLESENERLNAKIQEAMRDTALEKLRTLRSELASWQALTWMVRGEMQMAKAGYD